MGRRDGFVRDRALRQVIKNCLDWCAMAAVAPLGFACAVEAALGSHREDVFAFGAQSLALVPGLPGVFLRRAFYRMTLDACAKSFHIGFGAFFSHRQSTVGEDVYVGPYSIVGTSRLGRGTLIGSRVGIISGVNVHELDTHGRRPATNTQQLRIVEIGENVWIGEGSLIMAGVGSSSTVAAGSVVSAQVPPGVLVAGNPARFLRHTQAPRLYDEEEQVSAAV